MKTLQLNDPVYGKIMIQEPLLLDLYQSQAVQRLANIYQGGITAFIKPERDTTRLDHSAGVMLLLRQLGASLEEQAAGLIHDVPHTAFSHVVDFVFPNHDHTYHEVHREAFIQNSDLPAILSNHTIDWRWLSESENFSLLEQPLPLLCADRLDYFLRDGLSLGYLTHADVETFLANFQVWKGQIVIQDLTVARQLGRKFMLQDQTIWCSTQEVGWYAVMARALRAAIEEGVIQEEDLWGTDQVIMEQLHKAGRPEIQKWLTLLRPEVTFTRVEATPDMVVLPKVRAVDPPVLIDGAVAPLSQLDSDFAALQESYVASKQGEWGLRILEQTTF